MATGTDFVAMPISEYEGEFSNAAPPPMPSSGPGEPIMPGGVTAPAYLQPQPQPTASLVAPAFGPPAPAVDHQAATLRRRAGFGFLLAAGAAGAGAAVAGPWGAGAGLLLMGAARNTLRARRLWGASPEGKAEATRSGTVALVGIGVGGYCAYRAYQIRKDE